MSRHLPYPVEEHKARVLLGDPQAMAYCWIEAYVKNLNSDGIDEEYDYGEVTIDELIDTAMINIEGGETLWAEGYLNKGPLLNGVSLDPTFWDKLSELKGLEIKEEKRNNFFTCGC